MKNNTITLGELCVDDYLKPTVAATELMEDIIEKEESSSENITKIEQIRQKKELDSKVLDFETSILDESYRNSKQVMHAVNFAKLHEEYPVLDLSFLGTHIYSKPFKVKKKEFLWELRRGRDAVASLPRFAVLPFFGENSFEVQVNGWAERVNVSFNARNNSNVARSMFGHNYNLRSYLVSETGYEAIKSSDNYILSCEKPISFKVRFDGMIPQDIKKKAAGIKDKFGEGLYIVAEINPDEWSNSIRKTDPLLIGVESALPKSNGNRDIDRIEKAKAFYIEKFNTVPLEDYIRKEFTT